MTTISAPKTVCARARRRSLLAASTALGLAVLLTGCSTESPRPPDDEPSAVEPQLGPIRSPTEPSQIVRPIDQYVPSTQLVLQLVRAERAKQSECLRGSDERTIEWPLDEEGAVPFIEGARRDEVVRSELWGFFDPGNAAVRGYSRPADVPGALPSGIPAGVTFDEFTECSLSAHGAFPLGNGGGAYSAAYISSLPDGGPPVPTADSRVEAVVAAWSACMASRGFASPDPISALIDPRWQSGLASVGPEQIATATADMDCKAETNLVGIELAVQSAYDQEYIETHRDALDGMADLLAAYLGEEAAG
ncbi:hypothetical protein EDF22_2838 [Rathayibacter sp. PhB127]|uniref:hypothetical protein n=1 Tax=Rathayibacter sp. PhB127 TaxID=2485176 RepID=UPI000F4C8924|nr:hypothetical protein [Rathayibacter sp. PhB127]ROS25623.1 hypothetical protein EDF22_2838 [Rathayibacter sp. PhB127]